MNRNSKHIDDLFKEEIGAYTETPPPAIWDRLEKKLDSKPPKATGYSYRWLAYFGALSVMLLFGIFVTRQLTNTQTLNTNKLSANTQTSSGNVAAENISVQSKTNNNNPSAQKEELPITQQNIDASGNSDKTKADKQAVSASAVEPGISERGKNKNTKKPGIGKKSANAGLSSKHSRNGYTKTSETEKVNKSLAYNNKRSSKSGPNADDDQPENEYNSSSSANTATNNKAETKDADDEIAEKQKKSIAPVKKDDKKPAPKKEEIKPKPKYQRFEAGIKVGFERGFDNDAARKIVISPYLQYRITPKIAFMLQPSFKNAYLSSTRIGNARSYYQINNDAVISKGTSDPVYGVDATVPMFYLTKYHYSETHDTIVKSNVVAGTYMEFELPVLLKYYLGKNISVYGGVNIVYSKLLGISEHTDISRPIGVTKDTFGVSATVADAQAIPIRSVINYQGNPISSYTGPQYPATHNDEFRFGYMLGFSYEYNRRWLLDALVQQAAAKPNMQAGYNTNTALSAPYVRFTLGYKLTK